MAWVCVPNICRGYLATGYYYINTFNIEITDIEKIYETAEKFSPDYDVNEIYETRKH